ncbi:MAG TPA: DUF5985 family protein [Caulobacteraceae bacterium]|jgi:hypothetical protein
MANALVAGPGAISLFGSGALCCGYALVALFFLRSWTRTHDRFFAGFAAAFALMAATEIVAALADTPRGQDARAYLLRLLAFVIIILTVLDKNAAGPPRSSR